jgi:type VI secretion system secreted protein VgrG
VFAASDTGQHNNKYTYKLECSCWLSFLEENQNCRIFQNLTAPQIVEQVYVGHRRADFRFDLQGHYEPREYCVQFRETDLNFCKRLLEEEGIYFYIEHEENRHVVVMSDTQRFKDLQAPYTTLRFLPDGEESRAVAGREGVQRLQRTCRVRPNDVALRDFDYHVPTNRLDTDAQVAQTALNGIALQHYQFAAGYSDTERGSRLARLRLEAYQAESHVLQGQSNTRAMTTGSAFSLEGHPDAQRNSRYYVIDCDLSFIQDGPDSTSLGRNVAGKFCALLDTQPYHPLMLTPKPVVPGIHSATVVGPAGSEVHTDKLGRIRVHFHWDRYKTTEEDCSCWIRVSQAWAGKGWGVIAMPRVGQEVLVTYLDGDLDRPLVTGIVYNGDNPTPYDLPKDIRYTGIVSRSLKHGEFQHASQITFDDQRGAERVMVHAQQDLQHTVERNHATAVGKDMHTQIADTSTSTTDKRIKYQNHCVTYSGTKADYASVRANFRGTCLQSHGTHTQYHSHHAEHHGTHTAHTDCKNITINNFTEAIASSSSYKAFSFSCIGTNISKIGMNFSCIGIAKSMTGISSSMTGISCSLTGISISITGIAITHTGKTIALKDLTLKKIGMKIIS